MSNEGSFTAAATSPDAHQQACADCLDTGLTKIGIKPNANGAVDFGAMNSDQLCIEFAHAIELCLFNKGYNIGALSSDFINDRANKLVVKVSDFVSALVSLSSPR